MEADPLVEVTRWLVIATIGLVVVTGLLVVVSTLQYLESKRTSAEVKAQRQAIESMAASTRASVDELRAQRAAADPLDLGVKAAKAPEGATRFTVQGSRKSGKPMILTRWEIRPVLYRAGLGEPIAASDADSAIGPLEEHHLSPVLLPEDAEASVVLHGHPLDGLEQSREYRFRRREDGTWVDVTSYSRSAPWVGSI